MKRFLDDIFLIFQGTIENLHKFFEEINMIHPTIKFTMTNTTPIHCQAEPPPCSCPVISTIPYLDTAFRIVDRKIMTDLYKKPTDKNQYLLYSSCPPPECLTSIPYSLCTRINRICSEEDARDRSFKDILKELLMRLSPRLGPSLDQWHSDECPGKIQAADLPLWSASIQGCHQFPRLSKNTGEQ